MKDDKKQSKIKQSTRWIACPIEEEYFGSESRKERKQQRKIVEATDRSKYKKTDAKMLKKSDDIHENIKIDREQLCKGRVLSITSQGIIVDFENENYHCFLRGVLKKEKTQFKNLVTVGDFVLFEKRPEHEGYIAHIEPRQSVLSRADNLSRRKEQLIASNIDQVLITVSVVSPPLKPALIERYIIATRKGNMTPIIVVNKVDLLDSPEFDPTVREEERRVLDDVITAFAEAGIKVILTSVDKEPGVDILKQVMIGKASVFSGQSGVGKSSLINAVTGLDLPVGDVVEKTRKGAHTTTTTRLIRLDCGGFCIDTPGIKSFGIRDLAAEDVLSYFDMIGSYGLGCKFHNCTHTHEQQCAVIQAVEEGKISRLRYESYVSLIQSVDEGHKRR